MPVQRNFSIVRLSTEEKMRRMKEREEAMKKKTSTNNSSQPSCELTKNLKIDSQYQRYTEERIKQEKKLAEEEAARKKRVESNRKSLEHLKFSELGRKEEDLKLKGCKREIPSSGYPWRHRTQETFRDVREDVEWQKKVEQERKERGEASGLMWVKTDFGWIRRESNSSTYRSFYKSNPSSTTLPQWILEELDISHGFRQPNSPDFAEAATLLKHVFEQYFETSQGIRPTLMSYLGIIYRQLIRQPELFIPQNVITSTISLFQGARIILENVKNKIPQKFMPSNHKKLDDQCKQVILWHESIVETMENRQPTRCIEGVSDKSFISYVPREILVLIFSFLEDVRDLLNCSQVCYQWYVLANTDSLYSKLLLNQFPKAYEKTQTIPSVNFKEIFICNFMLKKGSEIIGITGMYQCEKCEKFFWASKYHQDECHKGELHKTPKRIKHDQLISCIVKRRISLPSDVLFL